MEFLFDLYDVITGILAIITAGLLIGWYKRWASNLPPGPWGVPLLGSIPFMEMRAEKTFGRWAKKYGPIIYVKLGSQWTVVLNSYEAIDQAFNKQGSQFNGRYHNYLREFISGGYGIINADGDDVWKPMRRLGAKAMGSNVICGSKSMEEMLVEQAEILCENIHNNDGKPFLFEHEVVQCVGDVISGIVVNKEYSNEGRKVLNQKHAQLIETVRSNSFFYFVMAVMPWLRFLPPFRSKVQRNNEIRVNSKAFYGSFIDDHEKNLHPSNPRDFIDMFLIERKRNPSLFTRDHLVQYIGDLFGAGTETTTSTICWIFLYLLKHPEIQTKLHQELDNVVGSGGRVKLSSNLPYHRAVIQEAYRIRTLATVGLPRRTTEDVMLMGYHIPKDTQVIANLWFVHNDPDVWSDPDKFDPDRHVDHNGNFVKNKRVIPFSVGPRNCLGEQLARSEILIFMASMLQKFEISQDPSSELPSLDPIPGLVCSPAPFNIVMKPR